MKLIKIKSKKSYSYTGKVYDLEVENDHSYNINGIIVHNSDYVMLGSIISQSLEACGPVYWKGIKIANGNNKLVEFLFEAGFKLERKYRGLSTKEIQREWGRNEIKTSEGIVKYNPIKYKISSWKENFIDYLKSAMSYTASNTLQEFRNAKINIISQNSFNRFNK
jgi:hypothetical protein